MLLRDGGEVLRLRCRLSEYDPNMIGCLLQNVSIQAARDVECGAVASENFSQYRCHES
jgi:hypothetical protein